MCVYLFIYLLGGTITQQVVLPLYSARVPGLILTLYVTVFAFVHVSVFSAWLSEGRIGYANLPLNVNEYVNCVFCNGLVYLSS